MKQLSIFLLSLVILTGCNTQNSSDNQPKYNESWAFPGFEKEDSLNPILKPSPDLTFVCPINKQAIRWEERNVLNPAAIVKDDKVYLFYRAQDVSGTSRIGLAVSTDGLHFEKQPEPVFYPDNDSMKSIEWNFRKDADYEFSEEPSSKLFDGT